MKRRSSLLFVWQRLFSGASTAASAAQQRPRGACQPGHVYVVATPIGNIGDISARALEVLSTADVIIAEDTRRTSSLLQHLNLPMCKHMFSHHSHNTEKSLTRIRALLKSKNSIALVSDAGTPGISDPGQGLVAMCGGMGTPVHAVPGASACISALSVSGFGGSEFLFKGFLPIKGKSRADSISSIQAYTETVVLYEAPHRVLSTMNDLATGVRGAENRRCVCCRELTKLHEEVYRGSVTEYISLQPEISTEKLRGEFVIVLGPLDSLLYSDLPCANFSLGDSAGGSGADAEVLCNRDLCLLRDDGVARSDAVRIVTESSSLPRSKVYRLALSIEW